MLVVEVVMNRDRAGQQKITPMQLHMISSCRSNLSKVHKQTARLRPHHTICKTIPLHEHLLWHEECLHILISLCKPTCSRAQQTQKYLHQWCLKIEWNNPLVPARDQVLNEPSLEIYSKHLLVQGSRLFHLTSSLCTG